MCINIISEFLVFIVLIKKNEVEIFISFKCLLISVLCEIRIRAWVSKRTLRLLVHFFSIARHWPYDGNVRRNCVHPAAAEGESSDAEINQPTIIVRFYFGQGEIWYSFHSAIADNFPPCKIWLNFRSSEEIDRTDRKNVSNQTKDEWNMNESFFQFILIYWSFSITFWELRLTGTYRAFSGQKETFPNFATKP